MSRSLLSKLKTSMVRSLIRDIILINNIAEAQLGGAGAHPPLVHLNPSAEFEKKEMAKISITGIRKPIELL